MNDDTTMISNTSLMGRLGLSVRGVAVTTMIVTICVATLMKLEVKEPLYSLSIAAVSYYFGTQRISQKS
ncbi:MAG: hypothetical protein QM813_09270 [Verrucomicrobiota bacterium]